MFQRPSHNHIHHSKKRRKNTHTSNITWTSRVTRHCKSLVQIFISHVEIHFPNSQNGIYFRINATRIAWRKTRYWNNNPVLSLQLNDHFLQCLHASKGEMSPMTRTVRNPVARLFNCAGRGRKEEMKERAENWYGPCPGPPVTPGHSKTGGHPSPTLWALVQVVPRVSDVRPMTRPAHGRNYKCIKAIPRGSWNDVRIRRWEKIFKSTLDGVYFIACILRYKFPMNVAQRNVPGWPADKRGSPMGRSSGGRVRPDKLYENLMKVNGSLSCTGLVSLGPESIFPCPR